MSDPSMTVGLVDDVDRDMIARGDRIGAALARSLLVHYDEAADRIAVLEAALIRQCDNMAFVVNHATLHNWHDKFVSELEQDRNSLVTP